MFSCPICQKLSTPGDMVPFFDHNEVEYTKDVVKQEKTEEINTIEHKDRIQSQIEIIKAEKEMIISTLPGLIIQFITNEREKSELKNGFYSKEDSRSEREVLSRRYWVKKSLHTSQQNHLYNIATKLKDLQQKYDTLHNML